MAPRPHALLAAVLLASLALSARARSTGPSSCDAGIGHGATVTDATGHALTHTAGRATTSGRVARSSRAPRKKEHLFIFTRRLRPERQDAKRTRSARSAASSPRSTVDRRRRSIHSSHRAGNGSRSFVDLPPGTLAPGERVTLRLAAADAAHHFKGFIIRADVGELAAKNLDVDARPTSACQGAIGHLSAALKSSVDVYLTLPSSFKTVTVTAQVVTSRMAVRRPRHIRLPPRPRPFSLSFPVSALSSSRDTTRPRGRREVVARVTPTIATLLDVLPLMSFPRTFVSDTPQR